MPARNGHIFFNNDHAMLENARAMMRLFAGVPPARGWETIFLPIPVIFWFVSLFASGVLQAIGKTPDCSKVFRQIPAKMGIDG